MDEATSRLAMELESVPTEIDEVQRRLVQLELAARQLAEETEEHAQERLAEIEEEMQRAAPQAGQPARAVGSRKAGLGRRPADSAISSTRVELEFQQLATAIKEKQAAGAPVGEEDYQQLYELDVERKKLRQRVEARRRREASAAEGPKSRPRGTPAAAPGSRPGRNRRSRQRLDRHSRQRA